MKFDFFSEKTQPLIGVDMSSTSVKMVELAMAAGGEYQLVGYSIVPIPKDAISDGNVMDLDQVTDCIKSAWKLLGTKQKRAAMALPSSAVITKKVIMPAGLREEDMEIQVEAEANQYIPFPLEEVNIDFQELRPSPNSPDEVEVLIAASRKEKIEDRVAAAEGADMKVTVMDVETYATEAAYSLISNQLPNGAKDQTVMVVDIGASVMHINVLHDNASVYTREQSFGGAQLTHDIQRRFGLSLEESEIAKRKGGLPETYQTEVLNPFLNNLATELARAIQFFTSSTQYNRIDHLVLAGGTSAIPGVDIMVQDKTQVNTVIANPFKQMQIGVKIKQSQAFIDAPSLLVACGLALRGV